MIWNRPQRDYIEYHYGDVFKYERFKDRIVPMLTDSIEPMGETETVSESDTLVEDDVDYTYELGEMLDRMRLGELEGLKGFDYTVDCTYIECIISQSDGWLTRYDKYPVNVNATLHLIP